MRDWVTRNGDDEACALFWSRFYSLFLTHSLFIHVCLGERHFIFGGLKREFLAVFSGFWVFYFYKKTFGSSRLRMGMPFGFIRFNLILFLVALLLLVCASFVVRVWDTVVVKLLYVCGTKANGEKVKGYCISYLVLTIFFALFFL